jgi:hypothetical protein
MEYLINIGLPILLAFAFYLIITRINLGDSKQEIFIKLRIFFGCIGIGVILSQAYSSDTLRVIIPLILLSITIFYGVMKLQKKYLKKAD